MQTSLEFGAKILEHVPLSEKQKQKTITKTPSRHHKRLNGLVCWGGADVVFIVQFTLIAPFALGLN